MRRWRSSRLFPIGVGLVLAVAAALACGPPERAPAAPSGAAAQAPAAPAPVKITVGYPVVSATYIQLCAGGEKGFWQAEGLELEPALTNGVPAIVQAILGGSYQLGSVSADVGILAVEQGADLVYVRGGKVIGAASVRGGTSTLLRALFTQHGLKEGEDYVMVAAGSTTERVTALRSRAIDAGLLAQPHDLQMRDEGFSLLGMTNEAIP